MLFCLMQLIRLNLGLINFGNIKMLFMISKPKFMEPEVGVVIFHRIHRRQHASRDGVGLKNDRTTGHLAACRSASRYMAHRKAMRQATELMTV